MIRVCTYAAKFHDIIIVFLTADVTCSFKAVDVEDPALVTETTARGATSPISWHNESAWHLRLTQGNRSWLLY